MRRSHEEAMTRVTARFQAISEQMAAQSRATPPQTPTRTHLSFPDMSFSPDTGQNDAVFHPAHCAFDSARARGTRDLEHTTLCKTVW